MRHKTVTNLPDFPIKAIEAKRQKAEEKKLKRKKISVPTYRAAICNILCDLADEYKAKEMQEAQKAIQTALTRIHTYNFKELEGETDEI